jgi:hypothetical protein
MEARCISRQTNPRVCILYYITDSAVITRIVCLHSGYRPHIQSLLDLMHATHLNPTMRRVLTVAPEEFGGVEEQEMVTVASSTTATSSSISSTNNASSNDPLTSIDDVDNEETKLEESHNDPHDGMDEVEAIAAAAAIGANDEQYDGGDGADHHVDPNESTTNSIDITNGPIATLTDDDDMINSMSTDVTQPLSSSHDEDIDNDNDNDNVPVVAAPKARRSRAIVSDDDN